MHWIDYTIIAVFFVIAVGAGFFFLGGSPKNSYFLGHENKWWILAASGASTIIPVNGSVWNLAVLMVPGTKSFSVTLVWPVSCGGRARSEGTLV